MPPKDQVIKLEPVRGTSKATAVGAPELPPAPVWNFLPRGSAGFVPVFESLHPKTKARDRFVFPNTVLGSREEARAYGEWVCDPKGQGMWAKLLWFSYHGETLETPNQLRVYPSKLRGIAECGILPGGTEYKRLMLEDDEDVEDFTP